MKKLLFYSRSLTVRILMLMILLVLPLSIWGVTTAAESRTLIYNESKNNISGIGNLVMNDLDNRMSSVDYYLFDALISDKFLLEAKQHQGDSSFYHAIYNLLREMYSRCSLNGDADAYFVYSPGADYLQVSIGNEYSDHHQTLQEALKTFLQKSGGKVSRSWAFISEEDELWLIHMGSQADTLFYGGMICVSGLYKELDESLDYQSLKAELTEDASDSAESLHIVCPLEKRGLFLHIHVDEEEILRNLPLMQRAGNLISVVFICLVPVLFAFLYHFLVCPIKVLLRAMNTVREGDWDYQITEHPETNEFRQLYGDFNTMIRAENKMSRELVEKETYEKKLELNNLQLQIRPHFLLNSFNLMYGLAEFGKTESVQKMLLYLSEYFRYIFRTGRELDLYSSELKLIVDYIEVARLRFPFISFREEHDEEILSAEVPPLMIHNFVENVLKHGLKPKGMTDIFLKAYYQGGKAFFIVEDNGRGIPEKELSVIKEEIQGPAGDSSHIGLMNSIQRMRHFFGDKAELQINAEEEKGTTIILSYPCRLTKEEEHDALDS